MHRFRIVAAILAVLTVAACSTPGTPAPAPGPALFYAKNGDIYISDPPGSPGRRLTTGSVDSRPAPSPDGSRVAYIHKTNDDEPGGELWVLDVASGKNSRLVNPAAVQPKYGDEPGNVDWPRWSPTGERIALLKASFAGGGMLMTADAATGALTTPPTPVFVDEKYAWSPDGTTIAWVGGRSDVSPVEVGVMAANGKPTVLADGTNAVSVSYASDGRSVLFSNGDANGNGYAAIPFTLRKGGIYDVKAGGAPELLLPLTGYVANLTALKGGAVAFTEAADNADTAAIKVRDGDASPRTVAETATSAQGPAWSGESVAYIGTGSDKPLLIKEGSADARQVDTGVESFAWAARSAPTAQTGG